MQNKLIVICLIISMIFIGCATHVHNIGVGPQIGHKVTARQYYLLWGLVPLNSVDTIEMAGTDINGNPIENYEIQTQTGPVDIAITVGLGIVTIGIGPAIIQSRTITVTK